MIWLTVHYIFLIYGKLSNTFHSVPDDLCIVFNGVGIKTMIMQGESYLSTWEFDTSAIFKPYSLKIWNVHCFLCNGAWNITDKMISVVFSGDCVCKYNFFLEHLSNWKPIDKLICYFPLSLNKQNNYIYLRF